MNIRNITPQVLYVGVNDRVTSLFEGLWPLRYGVSYNSYIVAGSQSLALIDTVRIDNVREFLNNVQEIAADRNIDYLVINHMEPDHSGSIPEVVRAYPDIKIVGNAQTISMVRDFYHIDDPDRFLEVKEGSTISLGDRTLKFFLTPMVHWPETMMTYVEEDKVLFSGDAFGTFGALNGGVIDSELTLDYFFDEMYRYYSNIVGKYGKSVQRALAKLQGLPIDYICSTHGPVWHEQIERVIAITDDLANWRSQPGVTIIYGSMYGNTAEIAETIACQLAANGIKNIRIHNAATASMSDMISDAFRYQGLIVGSATYSMRLFPAIEAFLNAMETREIKNKVFATFGSYTWAKGVNDNEFNKFAERLKLPIAATMNISRSLNEATKAQAQSLANQITPLLTK